MTGMASVTGVDQGNREAGLVSGLVLIAMTWLVLQPARVGLWASQALTLGFAVASIAALAAADPATFKGPIATALQIQSWTPSPVAAILHANTVAATAVGVAPMALAFGLKAHGSAFRILWLAVAAAALTVVAITGSRSAGLALAVGVAWTWASWARWRTRRLIVLFGSSLIAIVIVVATGLRDPDLLSRVDMWNRSVNAVHDRMITGLGFGAFSYTQEYGPTYWRASSNAHSLWLQTLVDFGLIGVTLLLVSFATAMWTIRTRWRIPDRSLGSIAAAGTMGAVLTLGLAESLIDATIVSGHASITFLTPLPLLVVALAFQPTTDARRVEIRDIDRRPTSRSSDPDPADSDCS